jgi:hypothetical protein
METDIRDIKGLVPVPPEGWLWLLVAFVALAAAIIFWVIRRKPTAAPRATVPPPTPLEVALAAMQKLRAENPPVEVFYTRLADILRHFIEGQFGLRAPEQTTEEFLAQATLPAENMALLGAFLQEADLVKFARHRPGSAEADRAWAAAQSFVEQAARPAPAKAGQLPFVRS